MTIAATTLPGTAGEIVERLGEDAHHDVYGARGAPVYHRLTEHDASEIPELLRLLRGVQGPVLELACGAGRLTLPLLAAGLQVTALDLSAPMIELLRERVGGDPRARRLAGRLEAVVGDMSAFRLQRRFAAIVLGTTSVTLLDDDGRASCLACAREHLLPGGRLLISAVDVGTDAAAEPSEHVLELPDGSGRLIEYLDPLAGRRWTSIVLEDETGDPTEVLSSCVGLVPVATLQREFERAGFGAVIRHRGHGGSLRGHEQVLLEAALEAPVRRWAPVAELFVAPSRFGDPGRTAVRAHGTTVHFADGATALCGTSGLWNVNLGYGNGPIADAIADATRDASYLTLFRHGHVYAQRAAEAVIAAAAPQRFDRVLFATAGGASVDAAIKIARQRALLAGEPRRRIVVGLRGSYHGMTFGAHGLTGEDLGQAGYGIDQRLVRHVDHADPREVERLLDRSGGEIAAVVLEPILGSGAHVVAREVLEAVLRGRDAHGYVVIADEVASGYGRTGPLFASSGWSAQPDLLVTSKGLTNGTCAASMVLWAPSVTQAFDDADAMLLHGETQAGAPASCAAIEATLGQFAELDALEHGARTARLLDDELRAMATAIPAVAEVRGAGCFRALALRDGDGAALDAQAVERVVAACRAAGAIVHPGPSAVQLVPALTYEPDDLRRLLDRVGGALARI